MTATLTLPVELQLTPKSQVLFDALMKLGQPTEATAIPPASPAASITNPTPIGSMLQGGKYAGISRGEDGQPDGYIVLLEAKPSGDMDWQDATAWAAGLGNDARLPTKVEAALLYANLKSEFDTSDWHWTSTPDSDSYAWIQTFYNGGQDDVGKSTERLCRAVRRFPI